jgi:cyclopropane-fatty-acyl-phospholipid synthase
MDSTPSPSALLGAPGVAAPRHVLDPGGGLGDFLAARGQPAWRGRAIWRWLHGRRATSFSDMTDLPRDLRLALEAEFRIWTTTVALQRRADDGTEKLLLELADGQRILELGCGWGSLSLWMAAHFPDSSITVVSNSRTQKLHIDATAAERGLTNLKVITCDVNELQFVAGTQFDRVVSVEMFEHLRNYQQLLRQLSGWMAPAATLFVHIFTHVLHAYPFEVRDESDWMAQYFFTGGIMPSDHLLFAFQDDLRIRDHWVVDGRHYQLTAEAWLNNMDANRDSLMPLLADTYGAENATRWWVYWRVFFLSCAELWGYDNGREWVVSHYLFEKP